VARTNKSRASCNEIAKIAVIITVMRALEMMVVFGIGQK
jgi:hypothetical protein